MRTHCCRVSSCFFFSSSSYARQDHNYSAFWGGLRQATYPLEFVEPFEEGSIVREYVHFRNLRFGSGHRKRRGKRNCCCGWVTRNGVSSSVSRGRGQSRHGGCGGASRDGQTCARTFLSPHLKIPTDLTQFCLRSGVKIPGARRLQKFRPTYL